MRILTWVFDLSYWMRPRAGRCWFFARWVFAASLVFVISTIGIRAWSWTNQHGGWSSDSYHNLSIGEYRHLFPDVDDDSLDLEGTSAIYVGSSQYIDGYDIYYRVTVDEERYSKMRNELDQRMIQRADLLHRHNPSSRYIWQNDPPDELAPPEDPPEWWLPPTSRRHASCASWYIKYGERWEGWHWIYSKETSELFIRRWNYQHAPP